MKTFTVKDINGFYVAIDTSMDYFKGRFIWWRGQSKSKPEWNLRPKIYRKKYSPEYERDRYHRFINKARVRYSKCPDRGDYASWLFLMQHYGLPTRLLDWSESPLIALYFAVQEEGYTGTLWGLAPGILNRSQGNVGGALIGGEDTNRPYFAPAFLEKRNKKSEAILSVLTDQFDLRHMVQSSAFTIHGISTPLNEVPNVEDFLVKIKIPKKEKLYFKDTLDIFGITESYLFPDLEHLANELEELRYLVPKDRD